jgi:hypothetical protein
MMQTTSFFVVLAFTTSALLLGWVYFRNYQLARPSVGVLNLGDVAFMIGVIILIPSLYLALPLWLVATIFALTMLGILYFMLEPVLRARWAIWLVTLSFVGADVGTNLYFGATSNTFFLVNNAVLTLAVVGITNLWAQSGMKARDIVVLGVVLAVYDLIATSILPLMMDSLTHLTSIPFAPVVAWGVTAERLLIGLGDLLLATLFPLVMRKAFGRSAGITAMAINLSTLAAAMTFLRLTDTEAVVPNAEGAVPLMTILGPLMLLQYGYWTRKRGQEQTTWQYLQTEPLNKRRHATGQL